MAMVTGLGPGSDGHATDRRRRVHSAVRFVGAPGPSRLATTEVLRASVRFAQHCERAGVDAAFVAPGAGADAFVLLGGAAAVTTSLVLGYLGAPDDQRPPALLAKHATALDVCCSGRAVFGIAAPSIVGAGREEATPDGAPDGDALGDAVEICRAMLHVPGPSYQGPRHSVQSAWNEPRVASVEPMPLALVVAAASDLSDPGVELASPPSSAQPGSGPSAHRRRVSRRPVVLAARFAELCAVGPIGLETARLETTAAVVSARSSLDAQSLAAGRERGAVRLLAIVAAGPADRQLASAAALYDAGVDGVIVDLAVDCLAGDEAAGFVELFGALAARRASED